MSRGLHGRRLGPAGAVWGAGLPSARSGSRARVAGRAACALADCRDSSFLDVVFSLRFPGSIPELPGRGGRNK